MFQKKNLVSILGMLCFVEEWNKDLWGGINIVLQTTHSSVYSIGPVLNIVKGHMHIIYKSKLII